MVGHESIGFLYIENRIGNLPIATDGTFQTTVPGGTSQTISARGGDQTKEPGDRVQSAETGGSWWYISSNSNRYWYM